MKQIHIALAANSNYVVPSTVLLQSVFEHNTDLSISIYLLFLEGSISETEIINFKLFVEERGGIFRPLSISLSQLAKFPETRHGKAALLRLCLPELLPETSKILYLDGDIIVKDSLTELYDTNLGTNYIAASKDTCPVYHPERMQLLGIDKQHWYFNSGVVLMNLEEFRKIDLPDIVSQYADKYFHAIESPDQDALNFICQGRTLYFHPRYNMNYSVEKDVAAITWGRKEVEEAKQKPVIIHYIGPVKPWSARCIHPRRMDWWNYLEHTPYAGYKPKDDSARNRASTCLLKIFSMLEKHFTLAEKRRLGRLLPDNLKKYLKKTLRKK